MYLCICVYISVCVYVCVFISVCGCMHVECKCTERPEVLDPLGLELHAVGKSLLS